jgi:hypothetical protein
VSSDIWVNLRAAADAIVAPRKVLSKYIAGLAEATDNVLTAFVTSNQTSQGTNLELLAAAPALDNYSVTLLSVKHQVSLYPASVWSSWLDEGEYLAAQCATAAELEFEIERRLKDPRIQGVVASILAQAAAE